MTHETLLCEKRYLACLSLIRSMRDRELLSDKEYARARTLLVERYQPRISIIFE